MTKQLVKRLATRAGMSDWDTPEFEKFVEVILLDCIEELYVCYGNDDIPFEEIAALLKSRFGINLSSFV